LRKRRLRCGNKSFGGKSSRRREGGEISKKTKSSSISLKKTKKRRRREKLGGKVLPEAIKRSPRHKRKKERKKKHAYSAKETFRKKNIVNQENATKSYRKGGKILYP